jgi:hypothetical protein
MEIARHIEKEMRNLPPRPNDKDEIYRMYRRLFYATKDACTKVDKLHFLFFPFPFLFKRMYLHKFDTSNLEKVCFELEHLHEHNRIRRENAVEYRQGLKHEGIRHPKYKYFNDNTIYGYSILIRNKKKGNC